MKTIESARPFLDRQSDVAVWYTQYHGNREEIAYANSVFSQTFGIPVEQVLAVKRYHLVNPPDTPEQVIEQYKDEDQTAIRTGCFFARNPLGESQSIEVVKLRFDEGMLGLFRILDAAPTDGSTELKDFDSDLLDVVREVRPDLLPNQGSGSDPP
jgi:PAS domain-containing protein